MSRQDFMKGGSPELLSRGKTVVTANSEKFFAEELAVGAGKSLNAAKFMELDLAGGKTGEVNAQIAEKVVELAEREDKNIRLLQAMKDGRQH